LPVALDCDDRLVRRDVPVVAGLLLHVIGSLLIRNLRGQPVVLRLIRDDVAVIARDLARDRVALNREADERRCEDESRQRERNCREASTEPNAWRPPPMSRAHARIMGYG